MRIVEHRSCRITRLEERATPTVACIERAGVPSVDDLHPGAEVRLIEPHQQMEVRVEEAKRVAPPTMVSDHAAEALDELLPIDVVAEDGSMIEPMRGDVVEAVGLESTRLAAHGSTMTMPTALRQSQFGTRPVSDTSRCQTPSTHAAASAAGFSSSFGRARLTNCPLPGFASSSSPSTITLPRRSTSSGEPCTSVPSKRL